MSARPPSRSRPTRPAALGRLLVVISVALCAVGCALGPTSVGGTLNPAHVPPAYVVSVTEAGHVCPAFPAPIIAAQLKAESGWNPNAVSPAGALGLAQFMPGTWASWGVDGDGDGVADVMNPIDAIATQARYDCWLAEQVTADIGANKYTGDVTQLALAAYNAGLGNVERFKGIPPFPETQAYVPRILQLAVAYGLTFDSGGTAPPAAPPGTAAAVIAAAERWQGTPYVWGGGNWYGPTGGGFDCSGLTSYAYYQGAHIKLPRVSWQQSTVGVEVPRSAIEPGDLITFTNPGETLAHHVAIYVGGGMIVHAPHTGSVVQIAGPIFGNSYWEGQQWHIRRVLTSASQSAP